MQNEEYESESDESDIIMKVEGYFHEMENNSKKFLRYVS